MQTIVIEGLEVDTIIGVYNHERTKTQRLYLDIHLRLPDDRVFHSDKLADTIDYAKVAELVRSESADKRYLLLERLGEHLCEQLFAQFSCTWIRIKLGKRGIVPGTVQVGVELERHAPD